MAMRAKDVLGREGEDIAAAYLERIGMEVLDRNYRCRIGEIDIVARDGSCLVVCEVKTRRSTAYGSPVEAVGPRELTRMRHLALHWLDDHCVHAPSIRFDVVGIVRPVDAEPRLVHLKGV
jgi:putative endonuclease